MKTTLTRSQLSVMVAAIIGHSSTTLAKKAVDGIFEQMSETLSKGGRIELRNFGIFEVVHRKAKKARNVYAGTAVKIPRRKVVKFWMGKDLHNRVTG